MLSQNHCKEERQQMQHMCASSVTFPKNLPLAENRGQWTVPISQRDPCIDIEKRDPIAQS